LSWFQSQSQRYAVHQLLVYGESLTGPHPGEKVSFEFDAEGLIVSPVNQRRYLSSPHGCWISRLP